MNNRKNLLQHKHTQHKHSEGIFLHSNVNVA